MDLGKTILSDRELYHDGQLQPILLSCSLAARAIKLIAGNLNLAQTLWISDILSINPLIQLYSTIASHSFKT